MECTFCHTEIAEHKIQFRADCPRCGRDLHICRNCELFDPHASNQCREPAAEPVTDKERANLCEYFQPARSGRKAGSAEDEVRNRLEALFKKG